jgi:hypothetical protein
MLRFQDPPDDVFTAILQESFEYAIGMIEDILEYDDELEIKEVFEGIFPYAAKVFSPQMALETLKKLLDCHRKPELYYLNDYHFLLIYTVLHSYCTIHNDYVQEARNIKENKELSKVGPFYIEQIDFNAILDLYFWDLDFLEDGDVVLALGMEGRRNLRMNEEIFAISQGLQPHPEELELAVCEGGNYKIEKSKLFGPKSKIYPDFDPIDSE